MDENKLTEFLNLVVPHIKIKDTNLCEPPPPAKLKQEIP